MDQHLRFLDECAELHENRGKNAGRAGAPSDPLERLSLHNPDMMLEIAKVRGMLNAVRVGRRRFSSIGGQSCGAKLVIKFYTRPVGE